MPKQISIKEFTPELQRAINKEVSNLKNPKRVLSKTELSEAAQGFLDIIVKGTWTQREDGKIDVKGSVDAYRNPMLVFFMGKEIFFGNVTGDFNCAYTRTLTSLEGAPEKVGGFFGCTYTNITSLKGAPSEVGDDFYCTNIKTLTSLKWAPKKVGGHFWCDSTKITSLEGSPEKVGGHFFCNNTKITSLNGIGEVGGRIYSDLK